MHSLIHALDEAVLDLFLTHMSLLPTHHVDQYFQENGAARCHQRRKKLGSKMIHSRFLLFFCGFYNKTRKRVYILFAIIINTQNAVIAILP